MDDLGVDSVDMAKIGGVDTVDINFTMSTPYDHTLKPYQ